MKVVRSVSLDVDILHSIAESAKRDNRSVSQWIEQACREKLKGEEKNAEEAGSEKARRSRRR